MVSSRSWILKAACAAALALACARADAQSPAIGSPPIGEAPPALPPIGQQAAPPLPAVPVQTSPGALSPTESVRLKQALDAARGGDLSNARSLAASLADPVARKLVQWASVDVAGPSFGFFDLDAARRDLWGWPRAGRRQTSAERALETAGLSPQRTVEWFEGKEPETAEGAMALASAYQQLGRGTDAELLIRHFWRDKPFDADVQSRMAARFAAVLTPDDYAKRLDMLLYGAQGPATRQLMDMATPGARALADARIALRANRNDANDVVARVPAELQNDPALAFEKARYYRKRNLDSLAAAQIRNFPVPPEGAGAAIWAERKALMMGFLKAGDSRAAYEAASNTGLSGGEDYAEAEFFAGYIALKRLSDPAAAQTHFENIKRAGTSPITLGRALYWSGRAAEARGDQAAAQAFWSEGARYYTAFYGQLAAERAGQTTLTLPREPNPTPADRERFEGREAVRAARMLAELGQRDLFRTFVLALDDTMPTSEELALLVDMARAFGDQDLAMRVVRAGAQRGLYLPERGYPVRPIPAVAGAPEPALVFAITRQESGFDPYVRSGVGARGMMQLMPTTASVVARKMGMGYSASQLDDPDYNMRLGAAYLGDLVQGFSGSYLMAAAGYNAGPGRPPQWAADCGDPRGGNTDPSDFIECIPFSETRNYVMRIMEAVQVYRARMNGGSAPLTALADLRRGGWGAPPPPVPYDVAALGTSVPYESRAPGSGPIPYAALAQQSIERRAAPAARDDEDDRRCSVVKVKQGKGRHAKTKSKTVCKAVKGGKSAKAGKGKSGHAKAERGGRRHGKAHAVAGSHHKATASKGGGHKRRSRR